MTEPDAPPRPAPKPGTRTWRTMARPFLLVATVVVVAVVVAETLLQVSGLTPTRGGVFTVSTETFERIPGIFEPGQDIQVRDHPQLRYAASIDTLGFRGPEFARTPADHELRVFVVGDGFVFGSFVEDDHTLPSRLEAGLSERCSGPVTVVNAGLPGSTIRDQIRLVERGLELEPDLVLLVFSEDDVRDLVGPSMWQDLSRNREAKSAFPLGLVYPVIRNSALWNLGLRLRSAVVSRRIDDALADADPDAGMAPEDPPPEMPEARAAYREVLTSLRNRLAEAGVPLVFAIYPSHLTVYGRWAWDQHRWIEGVAEELEIPTVSLLPPLQADGRPDRELYLLPHDGVASAAGYQVAADFLAAALVEGGLPAGGCG